MTNLADAAHHLMSQALHDSAAQTLLWVADCALPEQLTANEVRIASPAELMSKPWQQRYDLALVYLAPSTDPEAAKHLLSSLRDLHARQFVACLPVNHWQWPESALLALGLQQHARFHDSAGTLFEAWGFDIRTYKAVPDWLNPRFWANPENWNRFRW